MATKKKTPENADKIRAIENQIDAKAPVKERGIFRPLTLAECTVTVHAEQDYPPVRGNALASGDDAADRECEDAIIDRMNDGDVWAWAYVRVRVQWEALNGTPFHADAYLGGCSYDDEEDFREGGYFADMQQEALEKLNEEIRSLGVALAERAE